MQKKISILATVFLALLLIAFAPVPAGAWHHPPCTDDLQYERFGPRVDKIAMRVYGTQILEYTAFKAKEIDLMDWPLQPSQKAELDLADPNQLEYARAFYSEFGMREIDINNARVPTNDVYFRRALSHLINKDYFIATELAGMGHKMETPLGYLEGTAWYNTEVITYPPSIADAAAILDADNDGDGKADYIDRNGDGWRDLEDGTPINLVFYARSDDPQRTALGVYFTNQLEVALKTATGAGINVELNIAPKSVCFAKVMGELDYHMYTGGWSLGRDPDTLYFLYHSDFYWGPWSSNYIVFLNPDFDAAIVKMLYASEIGDKDTPSTAVYHAWESQDIFAEQAAMIPVWNSAGYGAYLRGWEGVVNGVGDGPWSWWTFLNGHPAGTEYGGTIRWGFMNDIEALNVIHSEWVWDWNILDKIYETLIGVNPYDVAEDFNWLAEGWEIGTWSKAGTTCTKLTFYLRRDVFWTDLEPRPAGPRKYLGTQTFYDKQVTAYDVDFSINYIKSIPEAWNVGLVADVDHTTVKDDWTIEVYYGIYMPLWSLHWVGGLPIIPKHIWEVVPTTINPATGKRYTREYDPIADRTLVGCGPYKFDYDAMIPHEYYELDTWEPASHGYFNWSPVREFPQTSTATGTPQIYVLNFKNTPETVDVELRKDGTLVDGPWTVTVPEASGGKPGMYTITSSWMAAQTGPITGLTTHKHVRCHYICSSGKYTVYSNTIMGDVTGDGAVTVSDCVKFSTFYGFNPIPFGKMFLNGDVDGNCKYEVLDAIKLQKNL